MAEKTPKYIEIYNLIKNDILSGVYPAGSFLPTENELVERYNISKTTVRHAVRMLRDRNMLEVRQGSGTKILPIREEAHTAPKYRGTGDLVGLSVSYEGHPEGRVKNTSAAIDLRIASEECAAALGIRESSPVWRLQRMQLVDDQVFGYMVNFISTETAPDLSSKGEIVIDLYERLKSAYGIRIGSSIETVNTIIAGFKEAQYLQVEIGTPLLLLCRTAYSVEGRPIEYCRTTVRPDIFRLSVRTDYNGRF